MHPNDLTHKFVAVLNKKVPVAKQMNALGHLAAGIVGGYTDHSDMRFAPYTDKDGSTHPSISDNGFIILEADNSNKLRTFRQALIENNIHFVDFNSVMTIGTHVQQHAAMENTPEADLEYYGVCAFGTKEELDPLTKKFSLWK